MIKNIFYKDCCDKFVDYLKKSHNTEENERKTHKNLTELWKKGELEEGEYYVKSNKGDTYIDICADGSFMFTNYRSIEEVLALVPSYSEWCQQKELEKADNCLINILMTQNEELKNLLKEIRGKIHYINTPKNQHNVFGNSIKEKINKILNDNS